MIPGDKLYYAGTDVLVNKYDIRDPADARAAEYKFASARELELAEKPLEGKLNSGYLKAIHKHLFQDMYEWAGQVREIDFAKRDADTGYVSRFARSAKIGAKAAELDKFLTDRNHLKGLTKPEFIKGMTDVFAKMNELHPFREGNGRSTRIFLKQLAREAGYEFEVSKVDKDRWNQSSAKAMTQVHPRDGDVKLPSVMDMRQVFHEACAPIGKQIDAAAPARESQTDGARPRGAPLAHAEAFDKLPPRDAYQRFPELEGAYRVLAEAQRFAVERLRAPDDRNAFLKQTRERISAELHQGREITLNLARDQGRTR